MTELTEEQTSIIEKVEKLLRLASKNPNEAEAASATAKAQELLAAYNLDVAMVGEVTGGSAKREQFRLKGGNYLYQRRLWARVAQLNFCMYWADQQYVHYPIRTKEPDGTMGSRDWIRYQWHHFIVGRVVNVAATRAMASYLEQSVERLLRDRLKDQVTGAVPNTELFSRWSISYRTGAMNRVGERIDERRNELIREENKRKADAQRAGVSTSNALTLSTYKDAETDANMDFIYGEGWSAKQAANRAIQAAARRAADEEYTRWAASHPEEAAKEEAKRRQEREKNASRKPRGGHRRSSSDKLDRSAYYAGYDSAEGISIDQQVGSKENQKRIA